MSRKQEGGSSPGAAFDPELPAAAASCFSSTVAEGRDDDDGLVATDDMMYTHENASKQTDKSRHSHTSHSLRSICPRFHSVLLFCDRLLTPAAPSSALRSGSRG